MLYIKEVLADHDTQIFHLDPTFDCFILDIFYG